MNIKNVLLLLFLSLPIGLLGLEIKSQKRKISEKQEVIVLSCCFSSLSDNNFEQLVKDRIELGNINFIDNNYWTPLNWAIHRNLDDIIELLINNKVNLNAQDNEGLTPVMFALKESRLTAVKKLILAGADTSLKDKNGKTIFDYASSSDDKPDNKNMVEQCIDENNIKYLYSNDAYNITHFPKVICNIIANYVL